MNIVTEITIGYNELIVGITGHRPSKLWNDYLLVTPQMKIIRDKIIEYLTKLREVEYTNRQDIRGMTGMAQGIDTLFALTCIELRIPFIAAIPCKDQEKMWPKESQERYWNILNNPLCTVYYVSDQHYTARCMQNRNEWMVNNITALIAVWDGSLGGTYNCYRYAQYKKKHILRLNPKTIKIE